MGQRVEERDGRRVIETLADGAVVVYGDPAQGYEAPTTTEITLDQGKIRLDTVPGGMHSSPRMVRLQLVTASGTADFPIETRTVGNSAINPQSTVLSGEQRWGMPPIQPMGYTWGRPQDVTLILAEKLLGTPIQLSPRPAMVASSLVNNILSGLAT